MSELKAIRSGEIYDMIEYENCYRTDDLYYPKSEVVVGHSGFCVYTAMKFDMSKLTEVKNG